MTLSQQQCHQILQMGKNVGNLFLIDLNFSELDYWFQRNKYCEYLKANNWKANKEWSFEVWWWGQSRLSCGNTTRKCLFLEIFGRNDFKTDHPWSLIIMLIIRILEDWLEQTKNAMQVYILTTFLSSPKSTLILKIA